MAVHLIDSALFGDQFGTEPMRRVFDERAVVRSWMQAEAALARAEAAVGLIPAAAACVDRVVAGVSGGAPATLHAREGAVVP